ncbi:hypothetical protein CsSME_00048161 [Camellia sinensis var. sinensis]
MLERRIYSSNILQTSDIKRESLSETIDIGTLCNLTMSRIYKPYRRPKQKLISWFMLGHYFSHPCICLRHHLLIFLRPNRERGRSSFMLEDQFGNFRFWIHARAKSHSSVKCICPEVHMFCSPLERENSRSICSSEGSHTRVKLLCLHVCSSVESHARARPLFQQKFEKCFKVSRHRTGARSVRLALVLSSQPLCLTLRFHAFGDHGLLASYGAKPIGAGLGRDTLNCGSLGSPKNLSGFD